MEKYAISLLIDKNLPEQNVMQKLDITKYELEKVIAGINNSLNDTICGDKKAPAFLITHKIFLSQDEEKILKAKGKSVIELISELQMGGGRIQSLLESIYSKLSITGVSSEDRLAKARNKFLELAPKKAQAKNQSLETKPAEEQKKVCVYMRDVLLKNLKPHIKDPVLWKEVDKMIKSFLDSTRFELTEEDVKEPRDFFIGGKYLPIYSGMLPLKVYQIKKLGKSETSTGSANIMLILKWGESTNKPQVVITAEAIDLDDKIIKINFDPVTTRVKNIDVDSIKNEAIRSLFNKINNASQIRFGVAEGDIGGKAVNYFADGDPNEYLGGCLDR